MGQSGMAKTEDYVAALSELEQMHASGQIDDARYEVHKAAILGEAGNPNARTLRAIRTLVAIPVALFLFWVLLRVLGAITNAMM